MPIPKSCKTEEYLLCVFALSMKRKHWGVGHVTAGNICSDRAQGSDRFEGSDRSISSRSLCRMLQAVRSEDSRVKAVVLRIDSPGGSTHPPPLSPLCPPPSLLNRK